MVDVTKFVRWNGSVCPVCGSSHMSAYAMSLLEDTISYECVSCGESWKKIFSTVGIVYDGKEYYSQIKNVCIPGPAEEE